MNKRLSIALLIVGSLLIVFLCIVVFIQPAIIHGLDLTETGQIGDTIGGIAAPIVGTLGAVLVFLSFKEQLEANRIQRDSLKNEITRANNAKDMDLFLRLFERLSNDIESFIYNGTSGHNGIINFAISFYNSRVRGIGNLSDILEGQSTFNLFPTQFYSIACKLRGSELTVEDKSLAYQMFLYKYMQTFIVPLEKVISAYKDNKKLGPAPDIYEGLHSTMSKLLDEAEKMGVPLLPG